MERTSHSRPAAGGGKREKEGGGGVGGGKGGRGRRMRREGGREGGRRGRRDERRRKERKEKGAAMRSIYSPSSYNVVLPNNNYLPHASKRTTVIGQSGHMTWPHPPDYQWKRWISSRV